MYTKEAGGILLAVDTENQSSVWTLLHKCRVSPSFSSSKMFIKLASFSHRGDKLMNV